jgi:hypothetical protein
VLGDWSQTAIAAIGETRIARMGADQGRSGRAVRRSDFMDATDSSGEPRRTTAGASLLQGNVY